MNFSETIGEDIRSLVSSDQLQEAIDRLQKEPHELSDSLQDDLTLLQRNLHGLEEDGRRGTLVREELVASRQQIAESILKITRGMSAPPAAQKTLRKLERSEIDARGRYLKYARRHVENLLRESIHNARFLDLGISDTPIATNLPWVYKNPDSSQEFGSIAEAFEVYERRLLILGAPGSGKSITLLHLARDLIAESEDDLAAPIPLIVNLSKFRFETPKASKLGWLSLGRREAQQPKQSPQSQREFEKWLADEFAERPGIPHADAQRWVQEGRGGGSPRRVGRSQRRAAC